MLQDLETGSLWWTGLGVAGNANMVCLSGPLQDKQLPRLDYFRGRWSSWVAIEPRTKLMIVK